MGRKALPHFGCPRCGYETKAKTAMRKHLFPSSSYVCAALVKNIELTTEIKEHVLANRFYVVPEPVQPTTIIHQHNTINNFIANMNIMTKLNHLMQYRQLEVQDFENKIEERFETTATKLLERAPTKSTVTMSRSHIMDMIHDITKTKKPTMEDLNVFYDKEQNRVCFFLGREWEDQQRDEGIRYLIDTLVSYYLDSYEVYLVRKLQVCSAIEKQSLTESLEEYYRFTSTFDVPPFVRGKCDKKILYNSDHEDYESDADASDVEAFRLSDLYNTLYERCKASLSAAYKKELFRQLLDIIKTSSKTNMKELNKHILDIIKIDEGFQKTIMM